MTVSPQNELSYLGVRAPNPATVIIQTRDPNAGDINFILGTNWVNKSTGASFELVQLAGGVASWQQLGAGAAIVATLTGDVGGAIAPVGGDIIIAGNAGQGSTTSGAGHTITISNSNWTTAQKGVGTLATNAEAIAGVVSTKAVVPSSLAAKLGTQTAHGVLVGEGTAAAITALAAGTNGQVLIGSTGADPAFSTITSPFDTIDFTLGAHTLEIDVQNDGLEVFDVVATPENLTFQSSSITDNGAVLLTYNLPAVATVGQTYEIIGFSSGGWLIQAGAGQTIHFAATDSTVGGTIFSTQQYSSVKLKCVAANTDFVVVSGYGTIGSS